MGGDMSGGREVKPAYLPPNPLYDPYTQAWTLGRDPSLVTLCAYCGISLGAGGRFAERHTPERCGEYQREAAR